MRRALALYRRVLPSTYRQNPVRYFSSDKDGGKKGPEIQPEAEGDDDFEDEMSFNEEVEVEEELPSLEVDDTVSDESELTPEIASDLVERMVAAVTSMPKAGGDGGMIATGISDGITAHTIRVLRAARLSTNEVLSPGSVPEDYPINRKVVAHLDLARLEGLSVAAKEAMIAISGNRYKRSDDRIKIVANRFRTSEENQAFAVSTMEKLVRTAKQAVGETIPQDEEKKLESWDEVQAEVKKQLQGEDVQVDRLLQGRDRSNETFQAFIPMSMSQQ